MVKEIRVWLIAVGVPTSGKLVLRMAPEVHSAALIAAQASAVSINQSTAGVLRAATHS